LPAAADVAEVVGVNANAANANSNAPMNNGHRGFVMTIVRALSNPTDTAAGLIEFFGKRREVVINDEFKSSMTAAFGPLKNKSIEQLIAKYSRYPDFVSLLNERKIGGLKARNQLLNLIASAVEWANQYRKPKASVPLLKNATENVLDDMVLYLVYVYERDALSIRIKDSLRARGANAAALRATLSQTVNHPVLGFAFARPPPEIPHEFVELLNVILELNAERARIWGLIPGGGEGADARFPYLRGAEDEELDLVELATVMREHINVARAIERKKQAILGVENFRHANFNPRTLEARLDRIASAPNPLAAAVREYGAVAAGAGAGAGAGAEAANAPRANAPAPAPTPSSVASSAPLNAAARRAALAAAANRRAAAAANSNGAPSSKKPKISRKNRKTRKNGKSRKNRK
jgi:hypothetical protein